MAANRKLSDDQFEAIARDRSSTQAVADRYGISTAYVIGIRNGTFQRKSAPPPRAATPLPPRHYRPFRDGTYPS